TAYIANHKLKQNYSKTERLAKEKTQEEISVFAKQEVNKLFANNIIHSNKEGVLSKYSKCLFCFTDQTQNLYEYDVEQKPARDKTRPEQNSFKDNDISLTITSISNHAKERAISVSDNDFDYSTNPVSSNEDSNLDLEFKTKVIIEVSKSDPIPAK
ncbi:602_t:CDS:2, partial [Racocetra persica]